MADGDFEKMSFAYFRMALQRNRKGADFFPQLRQAKRVSLLAIQKSARELQGMISGVSIGCGGGCEACDRLDGRRFSLEDAIRLAPVPCKDCTFTLKSSRPRWCRCLY
jgi:hypothetical protein